MKLHLSDLPRLNAGVRILGSGGGAPSTVALQISRMGWAEEDSVSIMPFDLLDQDAWVVSAAVVGAGSMYGERPPSGTEFQQAYDRLVSHVGVSPSALLCAEIAGMNGLFIVDSASQVGLPMLDGDLMGRALPRISQFSMVVAGHPLTPMVLVMPNGQTILIEGGANDVVERIVSAVVASTGGWACLALPPVRAGHLMTAAIPGSVSRALALGDWLSGWDPTPPVDRLVGPPDGNVLGAGRIVDLSRPSVDSSVEFASATLIDEGGDVMRVDMKNEFLLVLRDGRLVASTPDIIVLIDRARAWPIQCEELQVGVEVVLVRLKAPPFWAAPQHRRAVDLAAFGLAQDGRESREAQ
jgi:DUF917 family protein